MGELSDDFFNSDSLYNYSVSRWRGGNF